MLKTTINFSDNVEFLHTFHLKFKINASIVDILVGTTSLI